VPTLAMAELESSSDVWSLRGRILVARGLRILSDFAGFCIRNCWIHFVFRVNGPTHNRRSLVRVQPPHQLKSTTSDYLSVCRRTITRSTNLLRMCFRPRCPYSQCPSPP
jgi:hypothetical protein